MFAVGGNNPWVMFNVPSNANDFSLASSNISEGASGFYQFSNPALLPMIKRYTFGASYNMMSLNRSSQVLSMNFPLPPNAALALSIMRSGTSDIQGRDIFNNNTELFSHHEILGMISFGVSFSKYFYTGLNIKASYSNLDNIFGDDNEASYSISNNGIGADAGFLINYSNLSLAVKIENLASSKNWDLNISDQGNSYEEDIPTTYKIGAHYKLIPGPIGSEILLYVSKDNSLNNLLLNRFGVKWNCKRIQSKLRKHSLGFNLGASFITANEILPVAGFYYSINRFELCYGVNFGSVDEGISHIFTWSFAL